jgi:hypothetical protein
VLPRGKSQFLFFYFVDFEDNWIAKRIAELHVTRRVVVISINDTVDLFPHIILRERERKKENMRE